MGRWAQARKRGTVKGVPSEFALSPPVPDVDFEGNSGSDTDSITCLVQCPDPADGMLVQVSDFAVGPWATYDTCPCNDSTAGAGCTEGLTHYFRCAWSEGGVQVSDWSTPALPVVCSS